MTSVNPPCLAYAISAARLAGEVLLRHFRKLTPGQVAEKEVNDWVTAADREAEAAITSYLARVTPDIGILAEEGGASGSRASRWVIDPLDGTTNFLRGFPHFAVSIALLNDDRIEVGVVHDPLRGETFAAAAGGGAACNGRPIRVSGRPTLRGAFVTTGFPFRVHPVLETYLEVFRRVFVRVAAIRRPGAAALDLAHTAAGIFDGFFEFTLAPWDIAAGALLVREAGGVISNLDGGDDVLTRGNVVAGTPAVHAELIALISPVCRDEELSR